METSGVRPPRSSDIPNRVVPDNAFGAASFARSFQALLGALGTEPDGAALAPGGGRPGIFGVEAGMSRLDPRVRSALYARSGLFGAGVTGAFAATSSFPYGKDPYGWRALARAIGDQVVGPGFGRIFEAQIDQESGFDPEVVFGRRRSAAGAEGIAQLMPQYYPHVNRLDPVESLQAAARTMRRNLDLFHGDAEKALAAYNAGVGRVTQAVDALGANWKAALPRETQVYLERIAQRLAAPAPGSAVWPVDGGHITAGFGSIDQVHTTPHTGLDIGAPAGTPVRSAAAGVVSSVQRADTGYGWHVVVDHGDGTQTLYGHLSRIDVMPGQQVAAGQVIAAVGSTGFSTGPHLHFELRRNGSPADPMSVLPPR